MMAARAVVRTVIEPGPNRVHSVVAAGAQDTSKRLKEARVVTPGLAFGFIAIVLVLVVGVVVALANVGTVYRAAGAVAHTNDVKAQLQALLASLIDAETGERGYIITGNDSYLEPYTRGVAATATEIGARSSAHGRQPGTANRSRSCCRRYAGETRRVGESDPGATGERV